MSVRRRAFSTSAPHRTALALLFLALAACAHGGGSGDPGSGIRFLSDDFPGALARARAEGKPLFVDAWAPWCHSCVSMKSYVFPDGVLSPVTDRYVWLEVDTEKPANRAFVEQFPAEALPDAAGHRPADRAGGPPMGGQRHRGRARGPAPLHRAGAHPRSARDPRTGGAGPGERGGRAGETTPSATAAFREALAATEPRSLDHGQAVEGLVLRLAQDGDPAACVQLAREELGHVAPGTSLATLVVHRPVLRARAPGGRTPGGQAALGALEDRVGVPGPGPLGGADGRRPLEPLRDRGGRPARPG